MSQWPNNLKVNNLEADGEDKAGAASVTLVAHMDKKNTEAHDK